MSPGAIGTSPGGVTPSSARPSTKEMSTKLSVTLPLDGRALQTLIERYTSRLVDRETFLKELDAFILQEPSLDVAETFYDEFKQGLDAELSTSAAQHIWVKHILEFYGDQVEAREGYADFLESRPGGQALADQVRDTKNKPLRQLLSPTSVLGGLPTLPVEEFNVDFKPRLSTSSSCVTDSVTTHDQQMHHWRTIAMCSWVALPVTVAIAIAYTRAMLRG